MDRSRLILVSAPYMYPERERFAQIFSASGFSAIFPPVAERLEEEELLPLVADISAAIVGDDRFTRRVIEKASRLQLIMKWGTGIDGIDCEAAEEHGIAVFNTPNAFTDPVADSVLGYILCFARQIPWLDRKVREEFWGKLVGHSLRGAVLGVIGVGNIGRAVLRRASSFGMVLLGNDVRHIPGHLLDGVNVRFVSLQELLSQSDFISVNCDLNPTSFHLLNKEAFLLPKRTAVIINAARGSIIDESALVAALQENRIAGAALDVFEREPLPLESPLRKLPNVILAAHAANSCPDRWEYVHQSTIERTLAFLQEVR